MLFLEVENRVRQSDDVVHNVIKDFTVDIA